MDTSKHDIIINKLRGKRIELSTDAVKYTTSEILLNTTKNKLRKMFGPTIQKEKKLI